jgi:hypothetical protein
VFVIAGQANQLGNQLFMFGALIACAAEHDTSVAHLLFGAYADSFETTAQDLFCRFPARRSLLAPTPARRARVARWSLRLADSLARGRTKALQGRYIQHIESGYESTLVTRAGVVSLDSDAFRERVRAPGLIVFQGPLVRDNTNFRKHADTVRHYFRPRSDDAERVAQLTARTRDRVDVLIGLHIRHGDYRQFMHGRYFYAIEQYAAAVEHVRTLFGNKRTGVLVCSDSQQALDHFRQPTFASNGSVIQDLYALAACDYIVGPPSTFSQWASFYGRVPRYGLMDIHARPTLDDFRVAGM